MRARKSWTLRENSVQETVLTAPMLSAFSLLSRSTLAQRLDTNAEGFRDLRLGIGCAHPGNILEVVLENTCVPKLISLLPLFVAFLREIEALQFTSGETPHNRIVEGHACDQINKSLLPFSVK